MLQRNDNVVLRSFRRFCTAESQANVTIEYSKHAMTNQCPQCAIIVSSRNEFCPNCGARLRQSSPHNSFWSQAVTPCLPLLTAAFGGFGACSLLAAIVIAPPPLFDWVWFAVLGSVSVVLSIALFFVFKEPRRNCDLHCDI